MAECSAIAEQQSFELMHHGERHEPSEIGDVTGLERGVEFDQFRRWRRGERLRRVLLRSRRSDSMPQIAWNRLCRADSWWRQKLTGIISD